MAAKRRADDVTGLRAFVGAYGTYAVRDARGRRIPVNQFLRRLAAFASGRSSGKAPRSSWPHLRVPTRSARAPRRARGCRRASIRATGDPPPGPSHVAREVRR